MERYRATNKFRIKSLSYSEDKFNIIKQPESDEVMLSFTPHLYVDEACKTISPTLTAFFIDRAEQQLSNKLVFQMSFEVDDVMPISLDDNKQIVASNFGMIVSMFDTTIGAFRGVFFEWLKGSQFQHPLPLVELEGFLKQLNVSFAKKS